MSLARLHNLIVKTHKPVLILAAVATVCSVVALLRVGLTADYRLEAFVATEDVAYERFRAFMDEFTSNEFALVAIHGDDAFGPAAEGVLRELTAELRAVPAVARCSSIGDIPVFIRTAMGERLWAHPMLAGNLISDDRKTVAILCQMLGETSGATAGGATEGAVRRETVARMKDIVAAARAAHPQFEIMLTGPYVTLIDMYANVDRDLLVFGVLAFILTVVTLWAVFRRVWPMVFATAVGACALLCTLGLTIALGMVTSLITQMVVILVIVLSVANCVHLAVATEETCGEEKEEKGKEKEAEEVKEKGGNAGLAGETLRRMWAPCAAVMVTTAVGFGSVAISQIAPVRRFGALMAFGLLLSLVVSLAAVVPLHGTRRGAVVRQPRINGLLVRCAASAVRRPVAWVIVFAVGVGVVGCGALRLRFESDFVKNFRPDSDVRRGYRFIERNLSPLGSVELIVRARNGDSVATAANIATADNLGRDVVERYHMVKKALTLADPLTLLGTGVPTTDWGVRSQMALFRSWESGAGILRNFINDAGDALRINLRCVEGFDVHEKLRACAEIEELAAARFGPEYEVEVTGLYHFYAKLVADLLRDQYRALGLTVAALFGIIWVMLRSWKLTALVMIVNLAPVVVCLGAMGWAEIPVNMTTAMMLSVTLGIAVDDALHYVWRLRREYADCGDTEEAIRQTHAGVGRACVFTTVVIAGGFSILLFSRFLPTAYFGGLIGFTMLVALAADLMLLPALIALTGVLGDRRGAKGTVNRGSSEA